MEREKILVILYEMAMAIGSETRLKPLLTRTLQRLLYHTSFPAGFVCLDPPPQAAGEETLEVRLDVVVGDYELTGQAEQPLRLPAALLHGAAECAENAALLARLPGAPGRYRAFLRLPIEGGGVIVLLAPRSPETDLPLTSVFQTTMAHLAHAIVLCRHHEAYEAGIVAERASARQALEESEEKFRLISASAQNAIIMLDDKGRIVYWNPAAERIFGYRADEISGRDFHSVFVPERYLTAFEKGFAAFRVSGNGALIGNTFEFEALRRDGTEFPVELSVSALRLKDRWHAVAIMRDISVRKRAEAAVRRLSQQNRLILDSTGEGIFGVDLEGLCTLANPAAARMLGYAPEELIGQPAHALFHHTRSDGSPYPEAECHIQKAHSDGLVYHGSDEVFWRKDGSPFPVEYMSTPIVEDGRLVGAVVSFSDITERRLAEIALSKVNRALRTLSAGNEVLVRTPEEETLLREMCRVIVETGGYRMAWVGYAEQDAAKTVRPVAQFGPAEGYVEHLRLTWDEADPRGRGPTGTAIRTHRPVVALDIATDAAFAPWRDAALARDLGSSIALPLIEDGHTLGALNIYATEPIAFDEQEISLLQELATDLAYGILNLRARRERHKSEARLRETLVETIRAIARTVEKRDPYTAGHQQRVAEMAVAIARELGLDEGRIEGLRLGAMIHDIGKIYVPAEILNRPGTLTHVEFEIIKCHPQVGYDIVKDVNFPWPVAQMILQHHEHLDGSGYPNGLRGEDILLEARILSVADVVEAMATHRPYRPSRGSETAFDEIKANRGLLYDPDVVDACLRLFQEHDGAWPQTEE